uniref:Copper resistance protein B n=1 Tax=Pseudomonas syringae pv. actinidiae TaxID=103796 RepID=A0A2P0QIN1_PSESF|nr:Copper resistance protein B [Pseudomonas syringae pv. actinidiae]
MLAKENGSDHSTTVPATATDKPAAANDSKLDHGSMDHSKMSHESMDHDQKTKKAD